MKNFLKAALLCMLALLFVGCRQSELSVINQYKEGFYLMDARTAREASAGEIEKLVESGDIRHIEGNGSSFEYRADGDDAFEEFKRGDDYVFCFVSDKALEKAKADASKPVYDTAIMNWKMKNLTGIRIEIKDVNAKPDYQLTATAKTGF